MLNKILSGLKDNNIHKWLINCDSFESAEFFFIKKRLDMRRLKDVSHYSVTVYNDFDRDGKKMRGSSLVGIHNGMSSEEVTQAIKDAYFAASFVCNPFYEMPSGTREETVHMESTLSSLPIEEAAGKMAEALFAGDVLSDTFINSAELFVEKKTSHTINSEGIDVSFRKHTVKGEFVVQCTEPQDVETYRNFYYDNLDTDALSAKAKQTLEMTRARAQAAIAPASGEYTLILSDQYVPEIFKYYINRASASMIYPKYSNYQIGTQVQGEDATGELLNITLQAKEPYSPEGIAMKDRPLLCGGVLQTIHGNSRYSYYLGIEPTGPYDSIAVSPGSKPLAEMKSGPYLHVVNFSDFQMDELSGHFGGEIRLAYLYDGNTVQVVTGGSINGNLLEAQKNIILSKEMQIEKGYEGPRAISLPKVSVAGRNE